MTVDYDTSRQALAFARAFASGDAAGANEMLLTTAAEDLPSFTSTLAAIIVNALEVGGIPQREFFDAFSELVERRASR